jgi:asparagine synthase (glutamine-hydrolysing)
MKKEFYFQKTSLINQSDWIKKINELYEEVKSHDKIIIKDVVTNDNEDILLKKLSDEIVRSVKERIPKEKFGVLFSGGVDSSLIALILKKAGCDFNCYTLGFKNEDTKEPEDIEAAQKASKLLSLSLKNKILDVNEAEKLIKKTVEVLGPKLNNVVNVGVGGVVIGCLELAKKDNITYFFTGLGSEELFAGYERHRQSVDVDKECWSGLFGMYERDLLRDATIAKKLGVTFLTPFLDEDLIRFAMKIPASRKINSNDSKIILREVAEREGLAKEISWRKKRAAQYGSRLDKAIDKIARQKKFDLKKEYLKSLE